MATKAKPESEEVKDEPDTSTGDDDLDAKIDARIKKSVGEALTEFFGEGDGKETKQAPPKGTKSVWKQLVGLD